MEQELILAALVTLMYCVVRFLDMKYVDKEVKPLKEVARDAVMVFIAATVGGYVFNTFKGPLGHMFSVVTNNPIGDLASTTVYTNDPGF